MNPWLTGTGWALYKVYGDLKDSDTERVKGDSLVVTAIMSAPALVLIILVCGPSTTVLILMSYTVATVKLVNRSDRSLVSVVKMVAESLLNDT